MASKYLLLEERAEEELRIVLLGKTGTGKSATGNTILRRNAFCSQLNSMSVTSRCQKETGEFDDQRMVVVDTPGLCDTQIPEEDLETEISRFISFAAPGPHVFLVVVQVGRFTGEEQKTVRRIQEMLGEKSIPYTIALFTGGDKLTVDIETFYTQNKILNDFVNQCGGGYHVFNNKSTDPFQVRELMKKINTMVQRNKERCYTNDMFRKGQEILRKEEADLRIVLVGKTGVGKSSSGNTILMGNVFKSTSSSSSVTLVCQKETSQFDFKRLAVIDTPGLFHTKLTKKEVRTEIYKCSSFAAPGPHVFLIVIEPNLFTEKEKETVKIIKKLFGDNAARYTMVLFTQKDNLKPGAVDIGASISNNPALGDLIDQCGGRYHVFNNREKDPSQVRELLEKINTMVCKNGGSYYTNEMFDKAESAIEKEMERLIKAEPEMTKKEVRHRAERKNGFIQQSFLAAVTTVAPGLSAGAGAGTIAAAIGTGIGIEVAIGGAIGTIGGPVGTAVGAALGAGVGLAVGAIALKMKTNDCVTQ